MKAAYSMIAALGLVVLPADAATTDPEVVIYRFTDVRDDGGTTNAGVATIFHCTNFSGVTETVRFVTRNFDSVLTSNEMIGLGHLRTGAVATHDVAGYAIDRTLATGDVNGGTTAIAATSTNIICTAAAIDAANAKPDGVALRGIRFSPAPGSQE
jgi:hypothetical protein